MTKFYIDADNNYLGAYSAPEDDESEAVLWKTTYIPVGAIEVPNCPQDTRQKWLGESWEIYEDMLIRTTI